MAGIIDVTTQAFAFCGELSNEEEELAVISSLSEPYVSTISFLAARARFYHMQLIVFDNFPNANDIGTFVMRLTDVDYVRKTGPLHYKEYLALLSYIDQNHLEFKYELSYRILKLLMMTSVCRANTASSVIARLVLHQIAMSGPVGT